MLTILTGFAGFLHVEKISVAMDPWIRGLDLDFLRETRKDTENFCRAAERENEVPKFNKCAAATFCPIAHSIRTTVDCPKTDDSTKNSRKVTLSFSTVRTLRISYPVQSSAVKRRATGNRSTEPDPVALTTKPGLH